MEEPDYDDLIEDFMEDYEEPPPAATYASAALTAEPEYDEDFLAEVEAAHVSTSGANQDLLDAAEEETDSPISTNLSGRLLAAGSPSSSRRNRPPTDILDYDHDTGASPSAQVRSAYESIRGREGKPDPYSFERYKSTATWRQDTKHSPTTMRAREWKSKSRTTASNSRKDNSNQPPAKQLATTPEAQLLQYLTTHHNTMGCSASSTSGGVHHQVQNRTIRISRRDKNMSMFPVEGRESITMTLGDGNRVFVLKKQPEDDESSNSNSPGTTNKNQQQTYSLGISMTDLIQRVQAMQRKKEHDKMKALSKEMRAQRKLLARSATNNNDSEDEEVDENHDDDDDEEEEMEDTTNGAPPVDDQLWVDKHAPSSFANLLSEERTNREVLRALREWDPYVFHRDPPARPKFGWSKDQNKDEDGEDSAPAKNPRDRRPDEKQRVILLSGPPGVGKTTLAHIVANHCGYRPMEVNGSDERSASALTDRVVRAMETATIDMQAMCAGGSKGKNNTDWKGRPNCIIMDEIDGADAKQALQALVDLIRQDMPTTPKDGSGSKRNTKPYLKRPIIFICNNLYSPALRPLLPYARRFQVEAPSPPRLVARLRAVLSSEGLSLWGGATLLHELVTATGGDIRSCLYTLQFAAAEVHQKQLRNQMSNNKRQEDISKALISALNGNGMKDDRTDVAGTAMTVFRKRKKNGKSARLWGTKQMADPRTSVEIVIDTIESFGEHAKIMDCLYLNILNVSYIDPTFDRCAAALQWLSGADLRGMQKLYVPCAAAALHLLCRVEQKPDLTYTTRALTDVNYRREANMGLATKFAEGLPAKYRGSRSLDVIVNDTIPYALWMLSAGEGSAALSRPASSVEILNKKEQQSFKTHVETLHALGLTYVAATEEFEGADQAFSPKNKHGGDMTHMILEPPIDRLVHFNSLNRRPENRREPIPSAMKELLARKTVLHGIREAGASESSSNDKPGVPDGQKKQQLTPKPTQSEDTGTATEDIRAQKPIVTPPAEDGKAKRNEEAEKDKAEKDRPGKRKIAQNFLGLGAKRAKEAKSARRAKNVGLARSTKMDKKSNTGTGVPFRHVVRLKYVKGFTQAVRNPCRLEDLM